MGDGESEAINPVREVIGETAYNALETFVEVGWFVVSLVEKPILTAVSFTGGFIGSAIWDGIHNDGAEEGTLWEDLGMYTETGIITADAVNIVDDLWKVSKVKFGKKPSAGGDDLAKVVDTNIKPNPLDDPKIAKDIEVDPNAVYGYKPTEDSPLNQFDIDWSDPIQVEAARISRLEYIEKMKIKQENLNIRVNGYLDEGKTMEEIAEIMVAERNNSRIQSYIDKGDTENLESMLARNEKEYGNPNGPTAQQLLKKYGSYEEVINSSVRINKGMNVLLGID